MLIQLPEELELMFSVFSVAEKDPSLKEHRYKWSKMAVTSESLTQELICIVKKSPLSTLALEMARNFNFNSILMPLVLSS